MVNPSDQQQKKGQAAAAHGSIKRRTQQRTPGLSQECQGDQPDREQLVQRAVRRRAVEPEKALDPLHGRDAHQGNRAPLESRVVSSQQVDGRAISTAAGQQT